GDEAVRPNESQRSGEHPHRDVVRSRPRCGQRALAECEGATSSARKQTSDSATVASVRSGRESVPTSAMAAAADGVQSNVRLTKRVSPQAVTANKMAFAKRMIVMFSGNGASFQRSARSSGYTGG